MYEYNIMNRLLKITLAIVLCLNQVATAEEEQTWRLSNISDSVKSLFEDEVKPNAANKLFYYPIVVVGTTPRDYQYEYEDVMFDSIDGTSLNGWMIQSTKSKPKGVIVYSHGNTGSMNSHFGFCSWLLNEGYHLFMYDYRGYGKSEGMPERKGIVEDAVAAFKYTLKVEKWIDLPVISVGHSLGAVKSLVALDQLDQKQRIKAAVLWAGFSSYRKVARDKIGSLADSIVTDELSPIDHVMAVSKMIPLFFLHGEKDGVIKAYHSQDLFDKAEGEKKISRVENAGHNNLLWVDQKKVQKLLIQWLSAKLEN